MHKTERWAQFFDKEFFNLFDRSIILKELIIQIRRIAKPPASVLESGCGSGLTSVLLANMGYKVTAIDANSDLIQQLRRYETAFQIFLDGLKIHGSPEDLVKTQFLSARRLTNN